MSEVTEVSSDQVSMAYQKGMAIRREVLGDHGMEAELAEKSKFARPLQDFVTEFCWGSVWSRPGIDRKTRCLVTIAMLTALNRPDDLGTYVRSSIANGATVEEIREVLLQTAVYCGFPAALESFRITERTLREMGLIDD
jgi:4-carboxymuconolactone decarboxylase